MKHIRSTVAIAVALTSLTSGTGAPAQERPPSDSQKVEMRLYPTTAGTFGFWPAEMRHFAWTKGDTVLQLHGIGPWMITYVNSSDDPRTPK
ncbi:MAG: hypothetical protein LC753_02615 [Acidobacteria bacterium]|nr:hypothetical protein [Acidobacteriota bacterium]MCA1649194.1 hypothetical protein [Acidobacteriota bacterium]